jgi:hypothetical protein
MIDRSEWDAMNEEKRHDGSAKANERKRTPKRPRMANTHLLLHNRPGMYMLHPGHTPSIPLPQLLSRPN